MKNVRLDALPPQRPKGSRDCELCRKRRIRCDRTIPHCLKCIVRQHSCPGFDRVQLKWDKGASIKVKCADRVVFDTSTINTLGDRSTWSHVGEAVTLDKLDETKSPTASRTEQPNSLPELGLVHHYVSHTLSSKLLNHFQHEVAARLRWVDGPNNPWRSIVPSAAKKSRSVYFSLLNLAAAHQLATAIKEQDDAFLKRIRLSVHGASLQAVRNKVCLTLERGSDTTTNLTEDTNITELLMSVLALCHAEMLTPCSKDWNQHLRACRNILDSKEEKRGDIGCQVSTVHTLTKDITHLEAFRAIPTLTGKPSLSTMSASRSVFDGFTRFLSEVTRLERERHAISQCGERKSIIEMDAWQHELDHTFRIGTFQDPSSSIQRKDESEVIDKIIRAQYYANLIYSYQALARESEATPTVEKSTDKLYYELNSIASSSLHNSAHNIFWPLFIAGTEAHDASRQGFIQALINSCVLITGFWCNNTALQFLQGYWNNRDQSHEQTWIQYARENEGAITSFLVF